MSHATADSCPPPCTGRPTSVVTCAAGRTGGRKSHALLCILSSRLCESWIRSLSAYAQNGAGIPSSWTRSDLGQLRPSCFLRLRRILPPLRCVSIAASRTNQRKSGGRNHNVEVRCKTADVRTESASSICVDPGFSARAGPTTFGRLHRCRAGRGRLRGPCRSSRPGRAVRRGVRGSRP